MLEQTLKKVSLYLFITMILVALIIVMILFKGTSPEQPVGSVAASNEYNYTNILATTSKAFTFKSEPGALGSVVINVLGTGNTVFYDATSSIPAQRTIQATTSLPIVGVVAASQAAGTYTYDVNFYNGLIAVFDGTQGTSTVTWR
jgi:hypothetical protein